MQILYGQGYTIVEYNNCNNHHVREVVIGNGSYWNEG